MLKTNEFLTVASASLHCLHKFVVKTDIKVTHSIDKVISLD